MSHNICLCILQQNRGAIQHIFLTLAHCKKTILLNSCKTRNDTYFGILFGYSSACTFALMQCRAKQESGYTLYKVCSPCWSDASQVVGSAGSEGIHRPDHVDFFIKEGNQANFKDRHRCVAAAAVAAWYQSSLRACLFALPPVSLSVCHPHPVNELFHGFLLRYDIHFVLYCSMCVWLHSTIRIH